MALLKIEIDLDMEPEEVERVAMRMYQTFSPCRMVNVRLFRDDNVIPLPFMPPAEYTIETC